MIAHSIDDPIFYESTAMTKQNALRIAHHIVDRLIRCTYIFWSERHDELQDDPEDFDDGLASG